MTAKDLAREGKEGRESILTALKELRAAGYLVTTRHQDECGMWRTESIVYDYPQPIEPEQNPPKSKKPTSVSRTSVSRTPESSTLTEQLVEQPKKNNNSVGCCAEAQTLLSSPSTQLPHEQQKLLSKSLAVLQPVMQLQLVNELILQRSTIKNPSAWITKMARLARDGKFTPSPNKKQTAVHASHLPAKTDTLQDKMQIGQKIWAELNPGQRNQVAAALEMQLSSAAPRCLPLKQLRTHGVEHADVSRELFIYLAETPNPLGGTANFHA